MWPFARVLPTFKNESGLEKMAQPCGFAGFVPTFPLIFLINCEKKINKIYINSEKKWAFDHEVKNHFLSNLYAYDKDMPRVSAICFIGIPNL